jgi:hypothetical protein
MFEGGQIRIRDQWKRLGVNMSSHTYSLLDFSKSPATTFEEN